ncbi:glycosyltransferase family 25 protein [Parashewanella curva]|nr:glycosyltransferase family 25 protein [Parashewanella curva]
MLQPVILAINMPQNESRWQHLQQQLSQLSLKGTHFSAVVGSALFQDEIETIYDEKLNKRYYHRDLTVGEIGCYASHSQAWQKLLDSDQPHAVVLEDDINLSDDFTTILATIDRLQGWDIIKLSDNRNNPAAETIALSDTVNCISYKRVPNCMTGYVISRQGAEKLLARKRFFRPVDVDIQFHSELNLQVIGLQPYCVFEANFDSEIAAMNPNKRHSNKSTFWRNTKYRLSMMQQRTLQSANINKIVKPSNKK